MSEKESKSPIQVRDRRFWVVNENAEDEALPPEDKYPTFVEELQARAELAEQKLRERLDELAGENDAYRARLRADLKRRAGAKTAQVLGDFLEVVDNFERALDVSDQATVESMAEGVRLSTQLFLSKLRSHGIVALQLLHQPFDPEQAEAVGTIPVSDPALDGVVIEELEKGYTIGDQLLRPARVRIGSYQKES